MSKNFKVDPGASRPILLQEVLQTAESRYYHRLHALLLIASGKSCSEVGFLLDRSPRTVQHWAQQFAENGLKGLQECEGTGRSATLDDDVRQSLAKDLCFAPEKFGMKGSHWNGRLLMTQLADKYGITLSLRQCQRLLRSLT